MLLPLQQQADSDGCQSAREAVGGQHGENDGESQRCKQVLCRSFQKHHGGEDATYCQRGDQGRDGNSGRAMQRRFRQWQSLLTQQPVGVLDRHRRIIDKDPNREGKAAERHRIERLAEEVERDQRGKDRQWN